MTKTLLAISKPDAEETSYTISFLVTTWIFFMLIVWGFISYVSGIWLDIEVTSMLMACLSVGILFAAFMATSLFRLCHFIQRQIKQ